MTIKINSLELENVKRIKAVKVEPSQNGLTVIGGRNNQGKTSILDSIAWALGGNKFKPSSPVREGSTIPPNLHVTLSNGLTVERKGKNSMLKIVDPKGNKAGQQLLDEFIEELALNLPKFMEASNKEKANILLRIIGVGDQLAAYDLKEKELYQERLAIGRIADQKKKYAAEQTEYEGVPDTLISPQSLINQQQAILAKNGENQRKRERVTQYEYQVTTLSQEVAALKKQLQAKELELNKATSNLTTAKTDAVDLFDESTEELEKNLAEIEETNRKIRANLDKAKAEDDAREYIRQYDSLTVKINDVRKKRMELLKGANLPLPGLSVEDGELTYKGKKWDSMSGSDQLKVSAAIVRKLNPNCGFVLIDKLEQMDTDTMNDFGLWLEQEGLQAIATRVSTGDECSIIIEDGYVKEQKLFESTSAVTGDSFIPKGFGEEPEDSLNDQKALPKWKAGEF